MFKLKSWSLMLALLASGAVQAAPSPAKVSSIPGAKSNALILSSPPRETEEAAKKLYQPVAEYLSKVTGKKIVFKYPRTFGVYRTEMINGVYDIVFDGAQFTGYRVQQLKHNVLVKFPTENRSFVAFVRKNEKINSLAELSSQTVCAQPPPSLGTLVMLTNFDSKRQPLIVPMKGREAIYKGVAAGHCTAGVAPVPELKALDQAGAMRIIFESAPMPDQAFSVGPRVSPEDQAKIAAALLAPEAAGPTEPIRVRFKGGDNFVPAKNEEYTPFAELLRSEWGFYDTAAKN